MRRKPSIWMYVGIILLIVLAVYLMDGYNANYDIKSYTEFIQQVETGKVDQIYLNGYEIRVLLKNTSLNPDQFPNVYDYSLYAPSREGLKNDVAAANEKYHDTTGLSNYAKLNFDNPNSGSIWSTIIPIAIFAVGIVVIFLMFRNMSGGGKQIQTFTKSKARLNEKVNVHFDDVAGAEEEKEELTEIVDFLKAPKKYTHLGAKIPRGVLLVGPPGTGKTLFAKAVAGEANVPFYSISGSDFVEMYVGVGAGRVRDLFETAKQHMPCIVFIDEIDAVGRQRGTGLGGGHDEREQTLNQLLVQMDGFETNDGIIIMAATNRADILDPALLRPGRFDRQIYINMPDVRGREAILKVHARNKPVGPNVNFKTLARMTHGFSGADLSNLLNEAAIMAARKNAPLIEMADITESISKVLMGPQKKSRLVTESDKRITAFHEAGHAILACSLEHADPVQEVTIIPRGQAAGYTLTRPDNDDNHVTKNKLLDMMTMMLGGRVAEALVIEDISTGASNDIQRLSEIARKMVTEWGMSEKIGPAYYGKGDQVFIGKELASHSGYSAEMTATIDEEVNRIIDSCYKKATSILKEKRSILDNMARVLVEKETIGPEEVKMLMDGKSADAVIKHIDKKEELLDNNVESKEEPKVEANEEKVENIEKKEE